MNGEQSGARKRGLEQGGVALARVKLRSKPRRDVAQRLRHDLRSAVHALLGYSNLLLLESHGPLSEEQRRFASYVRAAAVDVEQLVELCVALTVPPASCVDASLAVVAEGARQKLSASGVTCAQWPVDALLPASRLVAREPAEQAFVALGEALHASGAQPLALRAEVTPVGVVLQMFGSETNELRELGAVDLVEHELENRAFVRLKLAEILFERLAATLRVSVDGRAAELAFR